MNTEQNIELNIRSPNIEHCSLPALTNCDDFANEILANASHIDLHASAATPAVGCDGARTTPRDLCWLRHLSCSSGCTPDVNSGAGSAGPEGDFRDLRSI